MHFLSFLSRSPGGTPVTRRRSKGGVASLSDPAALIAEALKRKFAQHRHNNSSDKENSLELSPFGSPESPKVCFLGDGPHTPTPVSMVYQRNCKGIYESISYKFMNEQDHPCDAVPLKGLSGPHYDSRYLTYHSSKITGVSFSHYVLTPMLIESLMRFCSLQNISGESEQNNIALFS